jgi:hypothetical protein
MGTNSEVYFRTEGWAEKVGDFYFKEDIVVLPETIEIMLEDGTVIAYVKETK